jgi:hypothetical protein
VYEIHIKDVVTSIQIGNNPVDIPMGRIELMVAVDLRKAIFNRLKEYSRLSSGQSYGYHGNTTGGYFEPLEDDILFPYISYNRYSSRPAIIVDEGEELDFQHVCFGSLSEEIIESLWRGDLITAFTYIDQWSKVFNVGVTGPLNDFKRMFHGCWPEMDNDQWRNSEGFYQPDRCMYGNKLYEENWQADQMESSYCETYECTFRNNGCSAYSSVMNPDPGNQLGEESNESSDDSWMDPHHGNDEEPNQDGEVIDEVIPDRITPSEEGMSELERQLLRNYSNVNTINIGVREDG